MADIADQEEESLWEKYNPLTGSYRKKTPMSVQMLDSGLDFTPVGTVKGVSDIVNEVQKDDPNYLKAAGLSAVELAAVLPVGGPILKGMLRKGDDVAAAVTKNIDETLDTKTAAKITDEDLKAWKDNPSNTTSNDRRKQLKGRDEELMALATEYQDSLAANGAEASKDLLAKYRAAVDKINPIKPINTMPDLISDTDVVGALGEKTNVLGKKKTGILSVNRQFKQGEVVTSRLDINGYTNHDKWVAAVRTTEDVAEGVSPTAYGKAVYLKNVDMLQPEGLQKKSLRIATGKEKGPHAVMEGEYQQQSPEEIYEYAKSVFDDSLKPDSEWVQIGYNPVRAGYFYDRATGLPLEAAEEVIQIGNLVLGRKVIKGDIETYTFNEGGLAMNNEAQMAALFEEGGIADDGMRVDPVSGNEIPPGSMASEVRDDVPAQLSEGEYVVPADVLRFYGVKFFEDLRSQAKQGMMKMEVDGRIGGEPVPPQGPQQGPEGALTPEEMAVLQEMGMNVGGMVPQQRVGYNLAGLEDGSNASTTAANVATQYGPGSSIDRARGVAPVITAPVVTMVTLYGPANEIVMISLPEQQEKYDELVALGYTTEQTGLTTATSVGGDDDDSDPPKAIEWGTASIDQFAKTHESMTSKAGKGLIAGVSIFSPMFGLGMAGMMKVQRNSMIKGAYSQLKNNKNLTPEETAKLKEIVKEMESSSGSGLETVFSKGTYAGNSFTEGLANLLTPNDGASYRNGQLVDDAGNPIEPGTKINGKIITGSANSPGNDNIAVASNDGPSLASQMQERAAEKAAEKAAKVEVSAEEVGGSQAAAAAASSTDQELEEQYGSNLNKGGFISKRSKKKKNK